MKSPLILVWWIVLTLASAPAADRAAAPAARETIPGPDGQTVEIFTLQNPHGLRARVMTWGATLIGMSVPDRDGKVGDVTLGFDELSRYYQPHPFFGSTAGRYANRIAKGHFTLDGHEYTLAVNNGPNHLHGGARGFDKRIWQAELIEKNGVRLTYLSADGEEGYPGKLTASVTYTLTDADELRLDYRATSDQPTVVNLTNHTYWNLAVEGNVLAHELKLYASRYTPADQTLIPTGKIEPVAGTPLDFTQPKPIGRDLAALKAPNGPGGYDHNFVVDGTAGDLRPAAELRDPASGRVMKVSTTEPGIQVYSAIGLNLTGKGGRAYGPQGAVCLETQHFPDSPNHSDFPTTVLRPGQEFRSTTVYAFSAK